MPNIEMAELERLKSISTPSITNGLAALGIACSSFAATEISCCIPDVGSLVGFAATALVKARPLEGRRPPEIDWWRYLGAAPSPSVVVLAHGQEQEPPRSTWGGVLSNIHHALGAVGLITNGHVCDVEDAQSIPFHLFAKGLAPTHGYLEYVAFGIPVTVGGWTVRPGDLIHADKYGGVVLPKDSISAVIDAVVEHEAREQEMIATCRKAGVTSAQIKTARDRLSRQNG